MKKQLDTIIEIALGGTMALSIITAIVVGCIFGFDTDALENSTFLWVLSAAAIGLISSFVGMIIDSWRCGIRDGAKFPTDRNIWDW